jgi:5'-nucleotidase
LHDQIFGADAVLIKGGVCQSDIPPGNFGIKIADAVLAQNPSLVTIRLSGIQIRLTIEEGISAAFDIGSVDEFPIAAGLRFNLNMNQPLGDRTSNMEIITPIGSWVPLIDTANYTVVTSSDLARGEDLSYQTILLADTSTVEDLYTTVKDEFVTYATEWGVLFQPPKEKMSAQSFS